MTATSSTAGIGAAGHFPSQTTSQTGQSTFSTTSTSPFISFDGPIEDRVVIKNRQELLAAQIEKAVTLITSSPEKKNLAVEGLIKYSLKRQIVQAEIDALQKALSHVQSAKRLSSSSSAASTLPRSSSSLVRSSSSSTFKAKKEKDFNPSELIDHYDEAVKSVKRARNDRHEAVGMQGNKEKKIVREIEKAREVIRDRISQAIALEREVLDEFNKANAEEAEPFLTFLKKAIDHRIEFGLINYGEQDILFTRETLQAQEHRDAEKRAHKLNEINERRERALEALREEIKDDYKPLLVLYQLSLRNLYMAQTEGGIEGKMADLESLLDSLNDQTSSKERLIEMQAAYLANSKDLHSSLIILTKPLEKGKLYSAKFALASLRRSEDRLKRLIEDLKAEADNKRLTDGYRENCRNIASRLLNEFLQANALFDKIRHAKDLEVRNNNDEYESSAKSENYAKLRSGFAEILITKEEKKILEKYSV